jgi:hypothetical protein
VLRSGVYGYTVEESSLIVFVPLLYNKISGSDVRKSLWDPSGTHLSLSLPIEVSH